MKRNIFASLPITILLLGMIFGITSCSENDKITQTQWKIVNVSVKKADWVWKSNDRFYQATAELPELTQFIFDEGGVLGYYKFSNDAKTALPFVKTYETTENGTIKRYTETISCDFNLGNPSTVTFTLEMSDLGMYDNGVPTDKNFQVVLIW